MSLLTYSFKIAPRATSSLAVYPPSLDNVERKPSAKSTSKPKKAIAAKPKTKQVGSGSDTSDYESDLEIEPPDEPSPLPKTRPDDAVNGAIYDTMLAVWSPRNKRPPADKVKGALVAFTKIIKSLRDVWKDQVQAMKSAENKGDNDKAAHIKRDVALQRQLMDTIVKTALDVGHPIIVEKYDNPPLPIVSPLFFLFARDLHTPTRSSMKVELITHVMLLLWRWSISKPQIIWLQLKNILTSRCDIMNLHPVSSELMKTDKIPNLLITPSIFKLDQSWKSVFEIPKYKSLPKC